MGQTHLHILAIAVGNSRTRLGLFRGQDLSDAVSIENTDPARILSAAEDAVEGVAGLSVVMASVNDAAADPLAARVRDSLRPEAVYRVGVDLPIPIHHTLDDASTVGHDRLLNAVAAFDRVRQACVVIDAGTAVTVDFVDGRGTFHGGAIGPGPRMMLRALHEKTAALPEVMFVPPASIANTFGKSTREAMQLGVGAYVIGGVRTLVERFAGFYEAYPQVIATGGDAEALFRDEPLIEAIVPDLQLLGIRVACERALTESADDAE